MYLMSKIKKLLNVLFSGTTRSTGTRHNFAPAAQVFRPTRGTTNTEHHKKTPTNTPHFHHHHRTASKQRNQHQPTNHNGTHQSFRD